MILMTRSRKTSPKTRKSKISGDLYHILTLSIKAGLTNDQAGLFADMFGDEGALSFSCRKDGGAWEFLWTLQGAPEESFIKGAFAAFAQGHDLPVTLFGDYKLEPLEDRDWVAESYRALPPFTVGSFFMYGSHYEGPAP